MLSPLFGPAMRLGQAVRGALPQALRRKVPERRDPGRLPQVAGHARQVLMLAGCVQPSMMPTIDAATIRVLDALGIGARIAPGRAAAARSASTWMNRTRRWRRCAPTSTPGGRWCGTDASRPS